MSAISDRYRKLAAAFSDKVERVPAGAWSNPSPCAEWTARDIVEHCVNSSGLFLGFVGQSLPDAPSVAEDPVAAWTNARNAIQAGLDDPAVAEAEFDGFSGKSTFAAGVDRFICTDLVIHGWDLACAAGLDRTMDQEEVATVLAAMESMPEPMLRSPGAFGPAVEAPADADDQTKLLAFLGRRWA
jgi:uncharacterized protein (TIGR03086 family)